jgi:hypothetical protein
MGKAFYKEFPMLSKSLLILLMTATVATSAFATGKLELSEGSKTDWTIVAKEAAKSGDLIERSYPMGTNSGGGTNKPNSSYGRENTRAILESELVSDITGFNFSIEEMKLIKIDKNGFQYSLVARTRGGEFECRVKVLVWNTPETHSREVKVIAAKRISGCRID